MVQETMRKKGKSSVTTLGDLVGGGRVAASCDRSVQAGGCLEVDPNEITPIISMAEKSRSSRAYILTKRNCNRSWRYFQI